MRNAIHDGQTQVRGKCHYWRERMDERDRWDPDVKPMAKPVTCSCFIEGRLWPVTAGTIPDDCPDRFHCRYHVQTY